MESEGKVGDESKRRRKGKRTLWSLLIQQLVRNKDVLILLDNY